MELGGVPLYTLERVCPRLVVGDLEGPVARLQREQFARGALEPRRTTETRSGRDDGELTAALCEGHLCDRRRVPGAHGLGRAPRRLDERPLDGLALAQRVRH